jgi:hypothetical protein
MAGACTGTGITGELPIAFAIPDTDAARRAEMITAVAPTI